MFLGSSCQEVKIHSTTCLLMTGLRLPASIDVCVTGTWKQVVGLVVPARCSTHTKNACIVKILDKQISQRKEQYRMLKLKCRKKGLHWEFPVYLSKKWVQRYLWKWKTICFYFNTLFLKNTTIFEWGQSQGGVLIKHFEVYLSTYSRGSLKEAGHLFQSIGYTELYFKAVWNTRVEQIKVQDDLFKTYF